MMIYTQKESQTRIPVSCSSQESSVKRYFDNLSRQSGHTWTTVRKLSNYSPDILVLHTKHIPNKQRTNHKAETE